MAGGGGSSKQTSESSPWKPVEPYLLDVAQTGAGLYRNTPAWRAWEGETVLDKTPLERAADQMRLDYAMSLLPRKGKGRVYEEDMPDIRWEDIGGLLGKVK